MKNHKKILLFHIGKEKQAQLKRLCLTMGIQVIFVEKKQYAQTLGALAGIQGIPRSPSVYAGEEFPLEMLVFSGLDSDALDNFLKKYKEMQLSPIPLKAVLTPHNLFWSPQKLYEELLKEHSYFKNS